MFHHMDLVNGVKYFGMCDHLVPHEQQIEVVRLTHGLPKLTIVIPVMDRARWFLMTLTRLLVSLEEAAIPHEIVVMDNSLLEDGLFDQIKQALAHYRGQTLLRLIYCYNPRLTFSTARSYAMQHLSTESELIASWDADIYCGQETWRALLTCWQDHPELAGVAPPLGSYQGGPIDDARGGYAHLRQNPELRRSLHMPGSIGEEIGFWNGEILETGLMRGAFCLKRSLVEAVAAQMPENEPWSRDMTMWSNVPFFICASELHARWGYVMAPEAVVVHDDRLEPNTVSMGTALPHRVEETLKGLILISYRNQVDTVSRKINTCFLTFNVDAIMRLMSCDRTTAQQLQEGLLEMASLLRATASPTEWEQRGSACQTLFPLSPELEKHLLQRLGQQEVFQRVKGLTSLDCLRPIYTIEGQWRLQDL